MSAHSRTLIAAIAALVVLVTSAAAGESEASPAAAGGRGHDETQALASPAAASAAASPSPSPASATLLRRGLAARNTTNATGELADRNTTNATGEGVAAVAPVHIPTFFWNVHWQCSVAAQGATGACKAAVAQRFGELARSVDAQIVTSIELSNGMSEPVPFGEMGLEGWTQVSGPCARGYNGDSAALAFAPGWQVENSGGGCLRHDWDTRAFAVAKVRPPMSVQGCPSLCVVGLHAPHRAITTGYDEVQRVCGAAAAGCSVAMGDWNVPTQWIHDLWSRVIGGTPPHLAHPNERTCCFPESHHYGVYDHVATNIAGAGHASTDVFDYQVLEHYPVQQHRPVHVRLTVPGER